MRTDADIPDLSGSVTLVGHEVVFSGPYSYVKQGTLAYDDHPPFLVAVKIIRVVAREMSKMQRKLRRETQTWWMLNHPNILPFMGTVEGREFGSFGGLISPWCAHGNADQYLHHNDIGSHDRMHLWSGVASAIDYLHNHNPQVIHADLKPSNILIDDNGNPLVCDFGLVRLKGTARTGMTTTTAHTGTIAYLSHELVADQSSEPSTYSDIHALGCIGLKFLLRISPYGTCKNNVGAIYMQIHMGRFPAERPSNVDETTGKLWDFLENCWNLTLTSRPTATDVVHFISDNGGAIANAIELTLTTAEGTQTVGNGPIYADQPSNEAEWSMDRGEQDGTPESNMSDNDSGFNAEDEADEEEEYDTEEVAGASSAHLEPAHDEVLTSSPQFKQTYRTFSITQRPGNHDRKGFDHGGKVILPAAAYDELAKVDPMQSLNVEDSSPWILRLQNIGNETLYAYAGVLDFTSEEDCVILPDWMMESLKLGEEDEVQVTSVSLGQANYLKLLAKDDFFVNVPQPMDMIKEALLKFVCLTQDTVVQILHENRTYEIRVQQARAADGQEGGTSLINAEPEIVLEKWDFKLPPTRRNTVMTVAESTSGLPVSAKEEMDNEMRVPSRAASLSSRRSTARERSPSGGLSEKTVVRLPSRELSEKTAAKPPPRSDAELPPEEKVKSGGLCSKCIIC